MTSFVLAAGPAGGADQVWPRLADLLGRRPADRAGPGRPRPEPRNRVFMVHCLVFMVHARPPPHLWPDLLLHRRSARPVVASEPARRGPLGGGRHGDGRWTLAR